MTIQPPFSNEPRSLPVGADHRVGVDGSSMPYLPFLDGLRALAILAVMVHNAALPHTSGGFIGVDLFFVLSGFLITSLLYREFEEQGDIRIRDFYLRRVLRLFPALAVFLVVLCGYAVLLQKKVDGDRTLAAATYAMLYVSNWVSALQGDVLGALGHTWSLSVEEQFYLVTPVLLLFLLRRGLTPWRLFLLAMAGMSVVAGWRYYLSGTGASDLRLYCGTDTRADTLLAGVALASLGLAVRPSTLIAKRYGLPLELLAWICLGGLGYGITIVSMKDPNTYRYYLTPLAIVAATLVASLYYAPQSLCARILGLPPLLWLGRISYSLYLWHNPTITLIDKAKLAKLHLPASFVMPGRLMLSLLLASASYYWIETRFLRLREKYRRGSS